MQKNNSSVPRVALYVRVSTEEQAVNGLSVDTQTAELVKWAKKNKCKIVDTYTDAGKTARKSLKSRVELARLLNDVQRDKIDLIVFTKLDRWFRNIKDYYKVQEILEKHSVNWKTIFENYDTTTANGRLYINIMLSLAQDEADRCSERIKAVFANKRANGEATCPSVPIGYRFEKSKILIDDERAELARDLFDYYYSNNSMSAARQYIIDKYNVYLHLYTIKQMLTNPLYKGEYWGYKDFCPALIPAEKFDIIQDIVKTRNVKAAPSKYDFIFTGMLVCSECGHKMAGNAQRRTFSGGVSGYYVAYRCNQFCSTRRCSHSKVIGEKRLEQFLLDNVAVEMEKYIIEFDVSVKQTKKAKIDKTEIKRRMEKLTDLYISDLIDIDIYKKEYADLKSKLEAADEPEKKVDLAPIKEFLKSDFLSIYKTLTNEGKRTVWRQVIDRIEVSAENDIQIKFTN